MTGDRRVADLLTGVALVCALAGAGLWLLPARADVAPLAPVIPAHGPDATAPVPNDAIASASLAARVVAANPLAPTREAPRARWTPPELGLANATVGGPLPPGLAPDPTVPLEGGGGAPGAMPSPYGPSADVDPEAAARARADRVPAFFGTVIAPDGARALLRLDARVPSAQLYAEGQGAGGWRVVRIAPDRVVIRGPAGVRTLRLPRAADPPGGAAPP